jgi:WD40 repeat protein
VGGKQFSLYNSFSQVNGAVLDYSIYGASLANTGDFALITKSEKYNSIVRVYKQNGDKYDYNFRDGYVTSASISEDGSRLAVALSFAEGSNYRTEIRVYKVGSSDYQMATCTISGIPYEIKIVEGGNIIAVEKNGINVFSSSMALIGEYLSENEIYLYHFGEDNIAIVSSHGARDKTTVLLLNKRGKVEKTHTIDQRALDIALADGYIFVQHLGGFERISTALGTSEKHDIVANEFKMLVYDKNTLVVCGDSYAKFLNFGNK